MQKFAFGMQVMSVVMVCGSTVVVLMFLGRAIYEQKLLVGRA